MAKLFLISSDEVTIEVDRKVVCFSNLIKMLLEDEIDEDITSIPIPMVNETTLRKVLQWCEHHKDDLDSEAVDTVNRKSRSTNIDEWDGKYLCIEDQGTLFSVMLAAYTMEIQPLVDLGCRIVANSIKGKSPEEIRRTFNIVNDFTPEEEEQIRRENEWAEDDDDISSYPLDYKLSDNTPISSQFSSSDADEDFVGNNLVISRHGTGLSIETVHKRRGISAWCKRVFTYYKTG